MFAQLVSEKVHLSVLQLALDFIDRSREASQSSDMIKYILISGFGSRISFKFVGKYLVGFCVLVTLDYYAIPELVIMHAFRRSEYGRLRHAV